MTGSGALRVHLTEEVNVYGIVDGNEVIQTCDHTHIVGVIHGSGHTLRVVVQIIIKLLCSGCEGICLASAVEILLAAVDLAGIGNINESVYIHFCMDAQILQIGFCDEGTDCIWHTADTQLQAGTVGDLLYDQLCNGFIHIRSGSTIQNANLRIVSFYNRINLGNMDAFIEAAETPGHIGIHFHDDVLGCAAHISQMGCTGAKIKVSMLVHGSYLDHDNIHFYIFPIEAGKLGITHGAVVSKTLINGFALDA